jgi:cytoskeleton protein RodZ
MRGITLDEIASATKIGSRTLRALEEEDFSKLPGGIFNKGFVRAYARYLGIDEEQAVADYLTAFGESKAAGADEVEHLKNLEANWRGAEAESGAINFGSLPWRPLLLLLLLLAGLFAAWHFRHAAISHLRQWHAHWRQPRHQAPRGLPPPAVSASAVSQAAVPAGLRTASSPPAVAAAALAEASPPPSGKGAADASAPVFEVLFHAREDSWVSITADGKPVMQGMLIARREATVRARQKITLLAGNAAAIEYSFNGQPQTLLGGNSNQVRTVTFTPEGLQP